MDWEFGISRCKLLHTEWRSNKVLHSTGNYIQYLVILINHMEKNMIKNICKKKQKNPDFIMSNSFNRSPL